MLSASPRSSAEKVRFTATRTEMHYCRVVGPRGLCRPLDEKQGFGRQGRQGAGSFFLEIREVARSDRPRRPRVPEICQPPLGLPPQTPQKNRSALHGRGFGVHLYCPTAERSMAGLRHYNPCIPRGFTLPHRSDGEAPGRAPMHMVSGALGSL